MDLKEYIQKTKDQREKLKLAAKKILDSSINLEIKSSLKKKIFKQFPSISPKRLQEYKEKVDESLKKFFDPCKREISKKRKIFKEFKTIYLYNNYKPRKAVELLPLSPNRHTSISASSFVDKRLKRSITPTSTVGTTNKGEKPIMSRAKSNLKEIYLTRS